MVVLVVEDEKKIAEFIKEALESVHYTVEVAHDGKSAIEKAEVYDYDLILLDIMLPDIDGFEVCKKIRQMGQSVPILMLTARGRSDDKVTGLDAGADDYLVKPFDLAELVARVRALIRRKGGSEMPTTVLKVGDLELDTAKHEVRRGGTLIDLTSKEYRILEYLMRNKQIACSRTMINEHVWGFNYVKSNIIDVYMSRLRNKVDTDDSKPLIHTVHGVGYKIKPF